MIFSVKTIRVGSKVHELVGEAIFDCFSSKMNKGNKKVRCSNCKEI